MNMLPRRGRGADFAKIAAAPCFGVAKRPAAPTPNMQKFTAILLGVFDERQPLPLEAHIFTEDASGAYPLPRE